MKLTTKQIRAMLLLTKTEKEWNFVYSIVMKLNGLSVETLQTWGEAISNGLASQVERNWK